jgi:hypothetical protein
VPIYYFQYQAVPALQSEALEDSGGAYINCWVKADSEMHAREIATQAIEATNWRIVSVEEECREVTEEDFSENAKGLEYYRQAIVDGECYVYHQWPNESQEGDIVH